MSQKGLFRRLWRTLPRRILTLYAGLAVLLVLPVLVFSYYAGRMLDQQMRRQEGRNNQQLAELSSLLIQDHFRQSAQFLQSYALAPQFRQEWERKDMKAVQAEMERALTLQPDMELVSTYTLDGTMNTIAPLDPSVIGRNYAWRDWYKGVAKNWSPYVSQVYRATAKPQALSIAVSVPIKDEQGRPVGVLAAAYSLEKISEWLWEARGDTRRSILIVDQSGYLLAAPDIDVFKPAVDLTGYEPVVLARQGKSGSGFFERGSQDFFAAYQPIPELGWVAVAEEPAGAVLQKQGATHTRLSLLAASVLLMALVGGLLLTFVNRRQQHLARRVESLLLSEAMYRSLVQHAAYGIYRSNERGLVYANPALVKMLGYDSEASLLQVDTGRDLFGEPEMRERVIRELLTHPEGQSFELVWKRKDGSPVTIRLTARAIQNADGGMSFEGIVEDVSSRYLLEEQLRHSERLAALGRMVAGAAHEINNPLTAILGYSELLASDPKASAEQRNFAEKIRQAARRTKTITTNLQSFSSQEKKEHHRHLLDLNGVVSNAVRIQDMHFGLNKISFEQRLEPSLPQIYGDEYQLLEVCLHILNNSVDALREFGGGSILALTRVEGENVVLEFSDTGPGIQDPARVFDPFYTTKPLGTGSGLGLSASYGIIKGHGGSIECHNRPEGGAVVTVTLPAARVYEPDPAAVALS